MHRKIGKNRLRQDEFHRRVVHKQRHVSEKKRLRDMRRLTDHLSKNVS
jgi:hypothetical protein